MAKVFNEVSEEVIDKLKIGGIGVSSTDTIYGVIGSALSEETVERIYEIKEREKDKPFIILISSPEDLKTFGIPLTDKLEEFLNKVWPGPVSVILPCENENFRYLHRGNNSLAFRLPEPDWLKELIEKTGPLVAPSANKEGKPPAETIEEAKKYFSEEVDFYLDKGLVSSKPSILIEVKRY
jgi:L-threonylcarbamoyladenylate synthase